MKLLRHGLAGQEKPGLLDRNGVLRDLSGVIRDIGPEVLSRSGLARLAALNTDDLPVVQGNPRLGVPVAGIGKFLAIGLNFADHAEESKLPIPTEPVLFTKAISCLSGPNDDVVWPEGSEKMDWEVELGVIIGTKAQRVSVDKALAHVAGYCLANDVSEREWQANRSGQWVKGKSFDTFGPIGPWLVTADELRDPQTVPISLKVNGVTRQSSHTSDMIFTVAEIVSHLSQFMTLLPGDVIVTGTPEGVGLGMKPPMFLKRGDVMELDGGVLGSQRQKVV